MYRIQKRKFSSNVLEKKYIVDGKENWVVFIVPAENKEKGDIECERLFNFYNSI